MRRTLAILGLVGLVVLAGCGGTAVDEEALNESAEYDWETESDVTVTVENSQYRYVYTLENDSEIRLSVHDELLGTQPVPVSAVKFRYENGTVVNASALEVEQANDNTVVTFPEREGQFAYTSQSTSRTLTVPVVTNRSHEVILPPGMRTTFPVFGGANPGNYETEIRDDQAHLIWSSIESDTITVDYYQQRDLVLFAGLVGVILVLGGLGYLYYRAQIRKLEEERSDADLDVDGES